MVLSSRYVASATSPINQVFTMKLENILDFVFSTIYPVFPTDSRFPIFSSFSAPQRFWVDFESTASFFVNNTTRNLLTAFLH